MPRLVLLRHGQSAWNLENRFTGWWDVDVTEQGAAEARAAGQLLAGAGFDFDTCFTSLQTRAIKTLNLVLEEMGRLWLPVTKDWRLNERHYGGLQGLDKAETLAKYGDEQFTLWRRSYSTPPPVLDRDSEYSQFNDPRYADIPEAERPQTECLADVVVRMLPYWESDIKPDLAEGQVVLVTAHGNSLRALVKHLDGISDADIAGLNIPTGIPLLYELDEDFQPVTPGGRYLDPEAAKAAIEAVKNQGKKK